MKITEDIYYFLRSVARELTFENCVDSGEPEDILSYEKWLKQYPSDREILSYLMRKHDINNIFREGMK